jgi:hypothetical protein
MNSNQFLEKTVVDYKNHLEQNFRADVVKTNLINTHQLLNSITGTHTAAGDSASMSFTFPFHGIFHDMKKRNTQTAEAELFPRKKPKNPHPQGAYPWYNKNLWSTIGFFIRELILGYVEEAPGAAKKHFPSNTI